MRICFDVVGNARRPSRARRIPDRGVFLHLLFEGAVAQIPEHSGGFVELSQCIAVIRRAAFAFFQHLGYEAEPVEFDRRAQRSEFGGITRVTA
jgi:hypothetical protein